MFTLFLLPVFSKTVEQKDLELKLLTEFCFNNGCMFEPDSACWFWPVLQ